MSEEKKSADIVHLTTNHLPTGGVDYTVAKLLEVLVNKASRGELLGLACTWVEGNQDVCIQIAKGSAESSRLVAGASGLFFEINKRWENK